MEPAPKRPAIATVYLWIMIILNLVSSITYFVAPEIVRAEFPNAPDWAFLVLEMLGILNVCFAIAIMRGKKWGFWGFVLTCSIAVFVNSQLGLRGFSLALGFVGAILLFGVLQIGGRNSTWRQLK